MQISEELLEKVRVLPAQPGVYQFYDETGTIIYVGKAKHLKKRVSSYFTKKNFESYKQKVLVNQIRDLRTIVVNSEADALLLENNLIKKYQPKYNILLKDDKTFPWICIKNEAFPRVFSTRKRINDGSLYFGPYTSAYSVKVLLNLIREIYQLRTCKHNLASLALAKAKYKVCLEYHIGNCLGPCEGLQTEENYRSTIAQIKKIIRGNLHEVIAHLQQEMEQHVSSFRFEEAEKVKQKIAVLDRYHSKSAIVSSSMNDVDVYSILSEDKRAFVNFLRVVKGAVVQAHSVEIKKGLDESDAELLGFVINDRILSGDYSSREIVLPIDLQGLFPAYKITVPQRGDKRKLLELSERNARNYRLEKQKRVQNRQVQKSHERILLTVQKDLRMNEMPRHIECFDNSNFQGSYPVAACVVFRDGKAAKKEYRHYNIKQVEGINDFASMEEVVYRRYLRLMNEEKRLPQLVIVDGGKGQLNAALKSFDRLGLRGKIALVGIAKRLEEIYFPGDPVPLYIDKNSESLKLIQKLRNEAHRFGISFHRQKRSGAMLNSQLQNIPGIGVSSTALLYKHFSSIEEIRSASIEQLSSLIGKARARKLKEYFA